MTHRPSFARAQKKGMLLGDPSRAPSCPPMPINKVWIEEGCISCNLCEDLCPEVFEVPAGETSIIKHGIESQYVELEAKIKEAAESCPVEVIKLGEG
jgi:ferredoxin